jgi:hypothetical protein
MNRFKITTAMLGLLAACFAPSMQADERNKETRLTINQPLQVQEILLAPGQYVFKLLEPDTNHTIVSIYSVDGARLQGTILGLPAYRQDVEDKELFTVSQPQGVQPAALKSWFFPGDNFGIEFPVKKLAGDAGSVAKSKGKVPSTDAAGDSSSSTRD